MTISRANSLQVDLDHIFNLGADLWPELKGARLFISGGTGFYGRWLLESALDINRRAALGMSMTVLTRNPEAFQKSYPWLANDPSVSFVTGDIRSFTFPNEKFSHIVHAASEIVPQSDPDGPAALFDVIVEGTRHMLEFARRCGAQKFLLTSSGAIYGKQGHSVMNLSEDQSIGPDPLMPGSIYGEAKRAAETLCAIYGRRWGFDTKITRGFATVGPYMAFDAHYAIGNFIRDAKAGGPIIIKGDGTDLRSYIYAADLTHWLWRVVLRGQSGRAYNVGSEQALSILQTAEIVRKVVNQQIEIQILGKPVSGRIPERYVPSTQRAQSELDLQVTLDCEQAISRTVEWLSHS